MRALTLSWDKVRREINVAGRFLIPPFGGASPPAPASQPLLKFLFTRGSLNSVRFRSEAEVHGCAGSTVSVRATVSSGSDSALGRCSIDVRITPKAAE
jgi:hypothetical protein